MPQSKKDGKKFYFEDEATNAVLRGAKVVYDAVSTTYGPKGKNVVIEKTYGRPVVTRDGVTVAKESYLEDRKENMGAQLLIEASEQTNRTAGDGTSATVAYCYELVKLGFRKITDDGANPMDVKQEILDDSYKILENLESMQKDVKKGQLEQVATVSSGDPLLGKLIAEGVEEVGPDGGLITEKAGIMGVDRTYITGYFMQQGFQAIQQGKKEIENCYIVVSAKHISSRIEIISLINKVGEKAHEDQGLPLTQNGQPVQLHDPIKVAFFGEIDGEAYDVIVANIQTGAFDATVTKSLPMGEMGAQYLEDLAILCGAKSIKAGENITSIDSSYIGMADKVSCTTAETTIFGGQGATEDLEKRKRELKDRLKTEALEPVQEKIRDRLSKLEGKVALFRIGGATETEREEKEFRIEDAIQSTRAAAQSGVVTGGGITLLKLSKTKGIGEVTTQALRNVFKKLMSNANLPADDKLSEALNAPEGQGYNLREGTVLTDLVASGILDPYLVIQEVVINASSTAANAVTIGAIICFIDEEK